MTLRQTGLDWGYATATDSFMDVQCYEDAALTKQVANCFTIQTRDHKAKGLSLSPGKKYYFCFMSWIIYGAEECTFIFPVTTTTSVEAIPSAYNKINVSWLPIEGVTNYTLQYSTSATFASGVTTVNGTARSAIINAIANTTYYFRVAPNPIGTNSWSPTSSAKTPAST